LLIFFVAVAGAGLHKEELTLYRFNTTL